MYLQTFMLSSQYREETYLSPLCNREMSCTCYTSFYPFKIFPRKQLEKQYCSI